MSNTTSHAQQERIISKKPFHQRNDSGELDVFEAARYFSGTSEVLGGNFTQKIMIKEQSTRQGQGEGGGGGGGTRRMSLEYSSTSRNSILSQSLDHHQKPLKEKKYKQPSSPGGRLASFLNSLFNQNSSKNKKKPSSSSKSKTQSVKDEDESPGWRRKRRSSISHFQTSKSESKSIYSTSSSGFRTPPPYANTLRSYSDHKPIIHEEKRSREYAFLDEKFKFSNGFSEKHKNLSKGFSEIKGGKETEFIKNKKFIHVDEEENDDGGDSDSSSDLFELTNCDLGYYSTGLPVYETTHMDTIKRGAPISSGST